MGQEKCCHYFYLIAEDSLDERVFKKVHEKYALVDKIIDNGTNAEGYDVQENAAFDRDLAEDDEPPEKKMRVE